MYAPFAWVSWKRPKVDGGLPPVLLLLLRLLPWPVRLLLSLLLPPPPQPLLPPLQSRTCPCAERMRAAGRFQLQRPIIEPACWVLPCRTRHVQAWRWRKRWRRQKLGRQQQQQPVLLPPVSHVPCAERLDPAGRMGPAGLFRSHRLKR